MRVVIFSALAALLVPLLWTPAFAQPRFEFDATLGGLPKDVVPSRYELRFDLDPARATFPASAAIAVRVRKPVAAIVLHANQLTAESVSLVAADGSEQPLAVSAGTSPQTWRLETLPAAPIAAGDYTLRIAYRGVVQASGEGLFAVAYSARGQPARMLATQLEAVFARMVFPCFDEPAFRAVFELVVRAPVGYEVLSNMPLAHKEAAGNGEIHSFGPTPPMPTYLVALAVGHFDSLEGRAAGVPLRILAAEGKRDQARYALAVTEEVVPFYTEYFGVAYALPKLDQLAVAGVRNGAMEDWGIISYTEPAILFDPARSSPRTQRGVYETIAHEVSHQWFGNLVTAAWWDEIWLNEAFATWMAAKATARFNPAWQADLHRRGAVDWAMGRDATSATRAIRSGPVSESSVFDVFDSITYVKGGAVLSMLEQWIGPDAFREGLAAYMSGQRLSNATAGDLWYYIGKASGRDVAKVAATWTDQPGFPLVRVAARCEGARVLVTLSQQRFSVEPVAPGTQVWQIPVVLVRGDERRRLLLEAPEQTIELDGCTAVPLIANAGGLGFYRVEYAPAELRRLASAFGRLPAADRVALFSDTFALAQAGRVPWASYFELLAALPGVNDESRGTLFTMAAGALQFLDTAMAGTPAQARVRVAGRALLAPALERLGWQPVPGEDEETVNLRGALIERLARFDDAAVIEQANVRFDEDAAAKVVLPASIRSAVIHAVGTHADRARFDRLMGLLRSASGEEDRWLYASALALGQDVGRAKELLDASIAATLPANIASSIPGMIGEDSTHRALAYDFALTNWDSLAKLAGGMFGARESLLPDAASGFNDEQHARQLIADQRTKAGPDGDASARRVASRIELRARVRQRDAAALEAFLAQPKQDD